MKVGLVGDILVLELIFTVDVDRDVKINQPSSPEGLFCENEPVHIKIAQSIVVLVLVLLIYEKTVSTFTKDRFILCVDELFCQNTAFTDLSI